MVGNSTSCPVSLLICESIKMEDSSDEDVVFVKEYIFHCVMNLVDLTVMSDGYLDQRQQGSPLKQEEL